MGKSEEQAVSETSVAEDSSAVSEFDLGFCNWESELGPMGFDLRETSLGFLI